MVLFSCVFGLFGLCCSSYKCRGDGLILGWFSELCVLKLVFMFYLVI